MYQSNPREGNETLFGFDFIPDTAIIPPPKNLSSVQHLIQGYEYYGIPTVPFVNIPPDTVPFVNETHEAVRRTEVAHEQMHKFFKTGQICNSCSRSCTEKLPWDL